MRPVIGNTVVLETHNVPATAFGTLSVLGFGAVIPGLDLTAVGMPGCEQHIALLGVLGTVPRIVPAVAAGDIQRPAVIAQIVMALLLLIYVLFGVKSFIDARRK